MTVNLGRGTAKMGSELTLLVVSVAVLRPGDVSSPAPNDLIHWDLQLSRIQSAAHIYGDSSSRTM